MIFRTDLALERRDIYNKANNLESDLPGIECEEEKLNDKISITTANGSFTIACNSVAGETTINIGFLKIADDPTAVTSTEFTILNNRIGDLDDLETTDQTSMVDAVNEVVGSVSSNTQAIANLDSKITPVYGEIISGLTYIKSANVVTLFLNGVSCSAAASWTQLALIPANVGYPRYSAHTKTMDGNDFRVSSGNASYRGSSTSMFGCITYVVEE